MSTKELNDLRRQFTGILRQSATSFRNAALVVEQYAHIIESGGVPSSHEIAQIASQLPTVSTGSTKGKKDKDGDMMMSPVDEGESKKRKRGPKKAKDPNAPKRPPSAYLLFQNAVRATVKQDHPDWTNHEVLAEVSKRWADLSPQDKKPFVDATALAKEDYDAKKAKYDAQIATNGVEAAPKSPVAAISPTDDTSRASSPAVVAATLLPPVKPRKSTKASEKALDTKLSSKKEEKKKKKEKTPPPAPSSDEDSDEDQDEDSDEKSSDSETEDSDEIEEPPKKKSRKDKVRTPSPPPRREKDRKKRKEEKVSKRK